MDVIILAAGKNTRLRGLVPAYMKPLILYNGRPLIASLVVDVTSMERVNNVIIVAAPQNTQAIVEVIEEWYRIGPNVHVVIQPTATGPADAVRRGLAVASSDEVMILCADNVVPWSDIVRATNNFDDTGKTVVTCRYIADRDEASRFTRVTGTRMYEGPDITNDQKASVDDRNWACWIGPVVVRVGDLRRAFDDSLSNVERISTVLDKCGPFRLQPGDSVDIGVPAALIPREES